MKKYQVRVNGVPFEVELELVQDDEEELPTGLPARVASQPRGVSAPAAAPVSLSQPAAPLPTAGDGGKIMSPLTGSVNKVVAQAGHHVKRGDVLIEIEAMKMNTKVYAPASATVVSIHVKEGDNIQQGQLLITVKED